MDCITCGYCWADVNEDGEPESFEYCHFDGPEGWAPCAQDEYDEEVEHYFDPYYDPSEFLDDEQYEEYLKMQEMEEAIEAEDYRSSVEYYNEPYDYQEF